MMKSTSARNRPAVWNSPPPTLIHRSPSSATSAAKRSKSPAASPRTPTTSSVHSFSANATGSVTESPRKALRKPEWNGYLTDGDRFRSSPDELRKRRSQLVSKHNFLLQLEEKSARSSPVGKGDKRSQMTSLDLLTVQSEGEYDNDRDNNDDNNDHHKTDKHSMAAAKKTKKKTTKKASDNNNNKKKKSTTSSPDVKRRLFADSDSDAESARGSENEQERASEDEREDRQREEEYEDHNFFADDLSLSSSHMQHSSLSNAHHHESTYAHNVHSTRRSSPGANLYNSTTSHNTHKTHTSSTHSPIKRKAANKDKETSAHMNLNDREQREIWSEIRALRDELRYYEQIAGERAILQSDALDEIFEECDEEMEENAIDHKKILRFLVQLVCQSMTHLLKKEVEHQHLQSQIDLLSAKINEISLTQRGNPFPAAPTGSLPFPANTGTASAKIAAFPTHSRSYIDPYASYNLDNEKNNDNINSNKESEGDLSPPPPPPPLPPSLSNASSAVNNGKEDVVAKMDEWIEYSKRVGDAQSVHAFQAMQMLNSSQRVALPSTGATPSSSVMRAASLPLAAQTRAPQITAVPSHVAAGVSTERPTHVNAQNHMDTPMSLSSAGFTGASPTDLLFMPFNTATISSAERDREKILSAPRTVSAAAVTAEQVTPETDPDLDLSPHAAAELAARTYDLYRAREEEEKAIGGQGRRVGGEDVSSSYDAMIDRLSHNLSSGLTNKSPFSSSNSSSSPVVISANQAHYNTNNIVNNNSSKSMPREEQASIVDPKPRAPVPLQAPRHPLQGRVTAGDYVHSKIPSGGFDTRKQLFGGEKKIFDATSGFF